jgi:hypothetical protein
MGGTQSQQAGWNGKRRRTVDIETLLFVIPAVPEFVDQKDLYKETQSFG